MENTIIFLIFGYNGFRELVSISKKFRFISAFILLYFLLFVIRFFFDPQFIVISNFYWKRLFEAKLFCGQTSWKTKFHVIVRSW